MSKKFNINDIIRVKLTDAAKDIYYHQYDDLIKQGLRITPRYPEVDENGYSKFQLWHFIKLYGPHIGVCKPQLIDLNAIYIEDEDLEEVDICL